MWYYDCPSTVLNLLEEFERELESDPVIFQFIEPDEGGDVEDMVTETVSDFSVAGFDRHPKLTEEKTFGDNVLACFWFE